MRYSEAKKEGVTQYTGKVCPHHPELGGKRLTSNGRCSGCLQARVADYRLTDEGRAARHEYTSTRWLINPEKSRSIVSDWRESNPGKANAIGAKYRAAKLQRTPAWSETEEIKRFYENCPSGHQVDHIVPLQGNLVSGLHVICNLQYLTSSENSSKQNKFDPEVFNVEC